MGEKIRLLLSADFLDFSSNIFEFNRDTNFLSVPRKLLFEFCRLIWVFLMSREPVLSTVCKRIYASTIFCDDFLDKMLFVADEILSI